MKMSKRSLIITIIVATLILLAGALCLSVYLIKDSKQTKIAFYQLSDSQKKAIVAQTQSLVDGKGKPLPVTFKELDATIPLSKQVKGKYDIVFSPLGMNAEDATALISEKKAKKIFLQPSVLNGVTSSVRQSALTNNANLVTAIPLLLDHNEIDIDRNVLKQTNIKTIRTWQDIETFAFAAKKIVEYPAIFAGGDTDTFLGIISSLTEAFSGKKAYQDAVETIRKFVYERDKNAEPLTSSDYAELVKTLCESEDAPLHKTAMMLSRWYKSGLLFPEVFHMTKQDVSAFMSNNNAPIVFMTLSQHRDIEHNTIEHYSSIYYPSEFIASQRSLCAPIITAIPLTSKKNVSTIISSLASLQMQEKLSKDSGLAPVQAQSRVPDRQADDVRYWIAATNAPITPLGDAAFTDAENKNLFFKELSDYIHFMK